MPPKKNDRAQAPGGSAMFARVSGSCDAARSDSRVATYASDEVRTYGVFLHSTGGAIDFAQK